MKTSTKLWAYAQIAEYTGLNVGLLRVWRSRGKLPVADFVVGEEEWPAWKPDTVKSWWKAQKPQPAE